MDAGASASRAGRCLCWTSGVPCTAKTAFYLRRKKREILPQTSKTTNDYPIFRTLNFLIRVVVSYFRLVVTAGKDLHTFAGGARSVKFSTLGLDLKIDAVYNAAFQK